MCFPVAQIGGWRSDQFRDLMAVLKFGAVDLDDAVSAAKLTFGSRFDDSRLPGTGWPKKEKRSYRPIWRP